MTWWVTDPSRARSEQGKVAELVERATWLGGVRWYVGDGLTLAVDFDITHGGETFPLSMSYALLHPHAPPRVAPRDDGRLSGHQYPDGQLCLEYRADNWVPDITGAMLIESAYRLISGERGDGDREVPSAHHSTLGQRTRGQPFRFLVMPKAGRRLRSIPPGTSVEALVSERRHANTFVATLVAVDGEEDLGAWGPGVEGSWEVPARAVSVDAHTPKHGLELEGLIALLEGMDLKDDAQLVRQSGNSICIVLFSKGSAILHFVYTHTGNRKSVEYRTLSEPQTGRRLPEAYDLLPGKGVGIVGTGSLGSKVAVSLARAGVGRFVLVDDDVFMPGNLARNELGQAAIGVHKVDALESRLTAVGGKLDVTRRRVPLGGQESSGTTDSVMSHLAGCDVVVDATADPHAFNFCAAVARGHRKPLVWGEVFAGGIGGLVARVRPDREPEPQLARSQIAAWFDARGVPAPLASGADPYAADVEADAPLVTDDAEVTIVAAHLTRLVTDALAHPGDTIFPSPVYVIGMRAAWMFGAPFETWPINLQGATEWSGEVPAASVEDRIALIRELMPAVADDDDQPAA